MSVEHEHEDGTKHAHKGGDKPHTHEKKSKKCACNADIGRNPRCQIEDHGDSQYRNWRFLTTYDKVYIAYIT